MKELLSKIQIRLDEMYPGRDPIISIYGDEGWEVEVDNDRGHGRIGGEMSGESIEELEQQLDIKL